VFEDVHWADEATLDLLRYLGRRLERQRGAVIATYRDDELGPTHPLRSVVGDLATSPVTRRLPVEPLSPQAVRVLAAGSSIDAVELHRRTGGNSFFVTEILASGRAALPTSVRDAVLARVARLPSTARATLDAAAVAGQRIEPWLLRGIVGCDADAIDACLATGTLRSEGNLLAFRHELEREAILAVLPAHRRIDLHRQILAALRKRPGGVEDVARLAHHAEGAGDGDATLRLATSAARRAIALGSHREAAAQYARALRCADGLQPIKRARLLDAYAQECLLTDQLGVGIPARRDALDLWRRLGDRVREGESLTWLARAHTLNGDSQADQQSRAAIDVLESMPPGPELARAYRMHAHLRIEAGEALEYGERAMQLAERLGDVETLVGASNTIGTALLLNGQLDGRVHLERSLRLAQAAGREDDVGAAYVNLGAGLGEQFVFAAAEGYLADGIAYCAEHDLDRHRLYMQAWLALVRMYQGRWSEAAELAQSVLSRSGASAISRVTALLALGRLHARRGDADAPAILDDALELATQMRVLHRVGPARIARAEAAWLRGDSRTARAEACAAYDAAVKQRHAWHLGGLAFWRWRSGDLDRPPHGAAPAFALQIAGDWAGAASKWRERGCPYDEALALADGDEAALATALAEFERLGARPMVERVVKRLRSLGVRGIPRGPHHATRQHPLLLTPRESEVLQLLAGGLTNAQIGKRLVLSERTVAHHVSAILGKLGVKTRGEAADRAKTLGPEI